MAKSREKIQQLGLWDPEVSAPDHDAVCFWADEHAEMILGQFSQIYLTIPGGVTRYATMVKN